MGLGLYDFLVMNKKIGEYERCLFFSSERTPGSWRGSCISTAEKKKAIFQEQDCKSASCVPNPSSKNRKLNSFNTKSPTAFHSQMRSNREFQVAR